MWFRCDSSVFAESPSKTWTTLVDWRALVWVGSFASTPVLPVLLQLLQLWPIAIERKVFPSTPVSRPNSHGSPDPTPKICFPSIVENFERSPRQHILRNTNSTCASSKKATPINSILTPITFSGLFFSCVHCAEVRKMIGTVSGAASEGADLPIVSAAAEAEAAAVWAIAVGAEIATAWVRVPTPDRIRWWGRVRWWLSRR